MLDRIAHQFSHRAHFELTKYVELVGTDCLGAERQAPRNVVNRLAVGDQAENRQFALDDRPSSPVPLTTGAGAAAEFLSASVAADDSQPATFKLQGIFYRPASPSAVVNTKTVFVGDRIANARVKAIDKQSVTLEVAGETKVLTLH